MQNRTGAKIARKIVEIEEGLRVHLANLESQAIGHRVGGRKGRSRRSACNSRRPRLR
jgi:hypothetical protein